jgi:hypothetical protein
VVAFVTEATMFGFGKNRVWYLLQKCIEQTQKHTKYGRGKRPHNPNFINPQKNYQYQFGYYQYYNPMPLRAIYTDRAI